VVILLLVIIIGVIVFLVCRAKEADDAYSITLMNNEPYQQGL